MKTFAPVIFAFLASVSSNELKCYDCEPSSDGRCVSPEKDNIKVTNCQDSFDSTSSLKKQIHDIDKLDLEPRIGVTEVEYECFSLYYETGDELTGVYRGCTEKSKDLPSSCDYLKETLPDGNVTICKSCSAHQCNTDDVGGASDLTVSLGIIFANLIVVRILAYNVN